MIQVRVLSIDDIIVTNPYLRLDTHIEELKKSIQAIGLIHPLILNQENHLIAGGRRYSALKSLGIQDVPVVIVEHGKLEQELISIDENLMRLPLKGVQMEQALNRGREIYETLYPEAKKVETTVEALAPVVGRPSPKAEDEVESDNEKVDGKASYVEVTAQKTGLSEGVIRSAIIRDVLSSQNVKDARQQGELGASQTNEIVKLSKEEQDKLLPLAKEMTTKKLREVVNQAKTEGLDRTLEKVLSEEPMPREYDQLLGLAKRLNRVCARILAEDLACASRHKALLRKMLDKTLDVVPGVLAINDERATTVPVEETPEPEPEVPESFGF